MNKIDRFINWINECENIVAITGAGFSTESGIPDFRGAGGIYSDHTSYGYPPEQIVSADFFYNHTDVFYKFCKKELVHQEARPNIAHEALVAMETMGRLSAIVTQNIDGLHQMAGSSNVVELHGNILDYYCTECHQFHPLDYVMAYDGVPLCQNCKGILKPDAILFGEMLKPESYKAAQRYVSTADMLIVAGTSLNVSTASSLLNFFNGSYLVFINGTATTFDDRADLVIHQRIGEVFSAIL